MKPQRLSEYLLEKKSSGKKALVSFLTAGYPDCKTFPKVLSIVLENSDVVEIGFPFSDPLADGSTIQRSSQKVLREGWSWETFFRLVSPLASQSHKPLLLMSYLNPVLRYGLEKCARQLAEIGFEGVLFPDLPVEEGRSVEKAMNSHGIEVVYLLSPTTSINRAKMIIQRSQGFVYLVSLKGVTGARGALPSETLDYLKKIRPLTSKPIYLGFGISDPAQVKPFKPFIDGVVLGSSLLDHLGENGSGTEKAKLFLSTFRKTL